jgi:hypothetical protein
MFAALIRHSSKTWHQSVTHTVPTHVVKSELRHEANGARRHAETGFNEKREGGDES